MQPGSTTMNIQTTIKKRVVMDFETRSMCDLKKSGAYKYSLDPATRPTCLAFKVHGEPKVYFLDFQMVGLPWKALPFNLRIIWMKLIDEKYEFAAHNAFFERCIYTNVLVKRQGWPEINPRQWRCTAAKAAACALPRSLEGAGDALKLTTQKDKRGYVAMMATCKPTKKWNTWNKACEEVRLGKKVGAKKLALSKTPEPKLFLEPEDNPEIWNTLYTYCKIDVQTEELLDNTIPDLIPQEQEVWHFNQKLNWRGIPIDVKTAAAAMMMMEIESKKKLKELDSLTMGLVTKPGARKSILDFLELDGITLPDIRAKTVQDELSGFNLTEDARRLLEIRQALSKTSTKKYQAFINRVNEDWRVRDIQLYHGASTGRDSGTGIQIQNFPRGLLKVDKKRPYAAIQNVIDCDYDLLQVLYGDSLGILFSAILRNVIQASENCEIFAADFSKIEVAVLWWFADNAPGLKILNSGLDPYKYMAAANTGKKYEDIPDEGDSRQLGKAQVLGCGFGMGATKFKTTAWDMYRLKLTDEQAKLAVTNYRSVNAAVPILWKGYENAAVEAVERGEGAIVKFGKCRFIMQDKFLWIELPSKRRLAYREPQISWRETDYGPRKTLEFYAVNSKTKKWALERSWGGTLAENIVQGAARDLLMYGMLRLEKAGYECLFSVHDEAVCQNIIGKGDLNAFKKILCEPQPWAKGLPVEASGWVGPRYRK